MQGHLIDALKAVHLQLSGARERYEKELERKQRSVARYIQGLIHVDPVLIYLSIDFVQAAKKWSTGAEYH